MASIPLTARSSSTAGAQLPLGSCSSSSLVLAVMPPAFTGCSSGASAWAIASPSLLVPPTRLPRVQMQPLWLVLPSVEPSYCSAGARVLHHGMTSRSLVSLKPVTNLLVIAHKIAVYPPTLISTASSRRAPALAPVPAPSTRVAATFPSANGSASHGLTSRTSPVNNSTRTPCWMTCPAHRKQSVLMRGQGLVRAVPATRLRCPLRLQARKAFRSSRSSVSRVSLGFNRSVVRVHSGLWVSPRRSLILDIFLAWSRCIVCFHLTFLRHDHFAVAFHSTTYIHIS